MLVQLFYFFAALAASTLLRAQDDAWHLDYTYTIANEELDPIVSPNAQSSHMHKIIGGSKIAAYYNYDAYSGAECSSLRPQADKSNYWMPNLYVLDSSNGTTTFTPVPAKIRFYYFLAKSTDNDPVQPFPKGLRMLVGNPNNKATTSLALFQCQIYSNFSDSITLDNFNFGRDCPWGMKTELYFPPCWDGYNLYTSDGSHMAYPSQGVRSGACPWTHPIRLPAIQLEYTWYTSQKNPGTALNGTLAWANGDTTGYGIHGDFVNGWDLTVLKKAMFNDTTCVGIGKAVPMEDCLTLGDTFDDAAAKACTPEAGILQESFGNTDLVTISRLPGCNPLWGSGTKPTCSPAVASLDVSAFKGTDGVYVADDEDRMDFILPTTPGWHNIACLHDVSSLTGGVSYTDTALTVDSCQSHCLTAGYQYAGTGEQGSTWNCVCGTNISTTATVETGMCTVACPGNSSQICGGSYKYNIFYAPAGTVATTAAARSDGSYYVGCYSNPSNTSLGLLGASTYSFSSSSMTTEVCITACAGQGAKWAATNSKKNCYCGTNFSYGSGAIVSDAACTTACSGNSSEICGDYYKDSIYNISAVSTSNSTSDGYLSGHKGCYSDTGSHLDLTNNSFTLSSMTPTECVNGCSELGYTYAGVYSGSQCYCGSTPSSSLTVLPSSQCQTACAGNSSSVGCGGSAAMDLYTVTSATVTAATVAAKKPANFIGCFKDAGSNLAFTDVYTYNSASMTVAVCKAACTELGYSYSGVETGTQCRCGNNYPQTTQMVDSLYCTTACGGNSSETCGASGYVEAYTLANSTTTVSMPGTSSSSYVGCYENSARGLTNYTYSSSSMTIEMCRTACSEFGYSLASVYLGKYCGCGDSWTGSSTKLPASQCESYSCGGNSTEYCGGSSQAALYNAGTAATLSKPTGWVGCYSDSTTSRTLTGYNYTSSGMTAKVCRTACEGKGYTYAGTENSVQCFCSDAISSPGTKYPSSSCSKACSGASNETCGAAGFLDIYTTSGVAAQNNGIAGYIGCYTDYSSFNGASYTSDYLSVDTCNQWCYARNATYGGVQNGKTCKCSTTAPSSVTTSSTCDNPCSGNSTENCGTANAIASYKLSQTGITSGAFVMTTNSTGYAGCYKEGSTRMLSSYKFTSTSMTNALCMSNCKGLGYAYAGTEYANECYCAASLNATAGGYRVLDADCSTACAGGVGNCGAGGTLSVWSTASVSTSSTTEGLQGCYAPGTFLSAAAFSYSGSYMTTQLCRRTCRASAYTIAGLTNANTCACGNSTTYGATVATATCNAACTGNSTEICGATSSSAVSIYDTTGAGAQAPAGYPANYVGCITDGTPRKMPNYSSTSTTMTSEVCRKLAAAQGYATYGTEYADECWATPSKLTVSLLADSSCTSACAGNSTEMCGAGGKLSYYYASSGVSAVTSSTAASSSTSKAASTSASSSKASTTASTSTSKASSSSSTSKAATSTSSSSSTSKAATSTTSSSTSTSKAATSTTSSKAATSTSTSKAATSTSTSKAATSTSTSKAATSTTSSKAATSSSASTSKAARRALPTVTRKRERERL